MQTLKIKPLTEERFIPPRKGSCQAAAFDVYAQTDLVLNDEPKTIELGFATEIPEGYCAVLVPRSGFGNKLGMRLMGTIGLIDSDFRGNWKATIQLAKGKELQLARGERFLQFYLMEVPKFGIEIVSELTETKRGSGGYGSTGTK
ncbi:dUTP diphosphatase [Shewanella chilikensis]|uniref:dUTP diphosphatase n=1 Tax=Shewanella chilikensis TaxID=558541 RepID=UPI003A984227